MGRVKRCRECGEVLYCKKCGARQSAPAPSWKKVLIQLEPEQKKKAKEEAEKLGISLSEYIRRKLEE